MIDDRIHSLIGLEERVRKIHEITLEMLRKTHRLTNPGSSNIREELIRELEEEATLLEFLKEAVTKALLEYSIRYQPLGRDFKRIHALLDVVYDMYRIGRYCREIALTDKYISKLSDESLRDLEGLIELAITAYENAYKAFFNECRPCVNVVKEIDEKIDKTYLDFLREVGSMQVVSNKIVAKTLVLRHIERIVDHSENIANKSINSM